MKESEEAYELLRKAYDSLDTGMLLEALGKGADINLCTEVLSFGIAGIFKRFFPDGEDIPDQVKWRKERGRVMEFLDKAFENGLLANECYDDNGCVYYPFLGFLIHGPEDFEFVDYLFTKGFDPVSIYDTESQLELLSWDICDEKNGGRCRRLYEYLLEKCGLGSERTQ